MPYRDGTGPMGLGALTGGGFGRGRGYGRGFAYTAAPCRPLTVEARKQALASEQKILETRLEALKVQLDALGKSEIGTI